MGSCYTDMRDVMACGSTANESGEPRGMSVKLPLDMASHQGAHTETVSPKQQWLVDREC